jgi:voltage-gated potassium channel
METGPVRFTLEFARIFFSDLGYVGPILMFLIVLISLTGFVIGRCEGRSKSDAVYHAFINATTVGYGDLRPTKKLSKMLAVANALIGLVFTGIVVAVGIHAVEHALKAI